MGLIYEAAGISPPSLIPSSSFFCRGGMLLWLCFQLLFQCNASTPSKNYLEAWLSPNTGPDVQLRYGFLPLPAAAGLTPELKRVIRQLHCVPLWTFKLLFKNQKAMKRVPVGATNTLPFLKSFCMAPHLDTSTPHRVRELNYILTQSLQY